MKSVAKYLSFCVYFIVNQGIDDKTSIRDASRIRLTNGLAFFLILNILMGIWLGKNWDSISLSIMIVSGISHCMALVFNHFKKYLLAKILVICVANFITFYFSYREDAVAIYLFFIPISFLSFILFRKKNNYWIISMLSLSFILFLVRLFVPIDWISNPQPIGGDLVLMNKIVSAELFIVCLFFVYYMFLEGDRSASLLAKEIKKINQAEEELNKYYQANLYLSQSEAIRSGDLQVALSEIVKVANETLRLGRVNIWIFDDNYSQIFCLAHHDDDASHESIIGMTIKALDCPMYFQNLTKEEIIVAENAREDKSTKEFAESYLKPFDIHSLLDIPIKIQGKMRGVICFEQTGRVRKWNMNEKEFGLNLASTAALVMETVARKQANEQLKQSLKAKDVILGILAHDLKNPISGTIIACDVVRNTVEDITEENTKLEIQTYTDLIIQSQQHALNIIQDLLENAKLEADNTTLVIEKVELNDFIHPILNTFERRAKLKHIQFSHNFYQQRLYANIDPTKFARLIENLISNAIKFTKADGLITIQLYSEAQHHFISIQDTGIGIPTNLQEVIFDKFTSAKRKGTDGEPTTGLGLFICKQIVEAHKGEIWVESKEGEGSTFYIKIPNGN